MAYGDLRNEGKKKKPKSKTAKVKSTKRSASHVDKKVGENIRAMRIERNWTQTDIAGLLNLSHQQFQKYEKGDNRISAGRLWDIAQVFGIEVGDLFEGVE